MEAKINIAIVEDDPFYANLVSDYLSHHDNYDLKVYDSGEDLLSKEEILPDLVILDYFIEKEGISMMNGLEIMNKLKKIDTNLPVLFMSNIKEIDSVVNLLKVGSYDYISKDNKSLEKLDKSVTKLAELVKLRKEIKSFKEKRKQEQTQAMVITAFLMLVLVAVISFY